MDSPATDEKALAALGVALRDHGVPRKAEDCFRRVLAKNPDQAGVRNALGGLLLSRGELEGALAEFDAALRLARGMVIAASNRRSIAAPGSCGSVLAAARADRARNLRCAVVIRSGPTSTLVKGCEKSSLGLRTDPVFFRRYGTSHR